MTKLELVKRLSQDCGVNKVGPSSTIGQVGIYLQLVQWIDTAYEYIQSLKKTWKCHRKDFSGTLAAGQRVYTPAQIATTFGMTDLREFIPGSVKIFLNVTDECPLTWLRWDDFNAAYNIGNYTTESRRPIAWSMKPDGSLILYPIPDVEYTMRGEYYSRAHKMTADDDRPIWGNEDYDIMIMFKAMMYYGADKAEPDKYAFGQSEYRKKFRGFEAEYLPEPTFGNPLA